ncbi:digestive cysteine proteinase 1 [Sipha flava]|uniref:Counting factor associated protein D n=1 Tax=Sipha flava TaxID=143950 RepID=A0A2S2QI22_9HEMI|nr:digestive cysteine proteinase 1 [Sipha flava]
MSAIKQLMVLLLLNTTSAASDNALAPKWSSSYSVQGEIYVPYAEVKEPFDAWYDSDSKNSRIDYYNGMVKTYQLSDKGSFGASLKIVPVTTETETNSLKCLEVNGTNKFHISPQSALPDLTDFKLVSEHLENSLVVEKWISVSKVGKTVNKYEMLLYREDNVAYPLMFQMNGFNSIFGSHFDKYVIVYKSFSPVKPNPEIFNVEDLNCESFPGPGVDHIYNFNPMMEFINNYGGHVDSAFEKYQRLHNRTYTNGTIEHFNRKNYFRQNLRYIHSKNRANLGYTLAVNHLADHSDEEIKSMCGYKKQKDEYNGGNAFPYNKNDFKNLPSEIDWRISGAVTPVKDQSICGSCWSFGTTGAVEGAYFMKHGERKSFSEQALVDCSWGFGNNGCDGGEDFRAYSWIEKHGLPTEDVYGPYLSQDGFCHISNITNGDRTKITSFVNVTSNDEEALKIALFKKGPISIAIFAALKSFSFYSTGVYYDKECLNGPLDLDHAVLLVGYGSLNGHPYWLVKNSWSTHWGNDGYILISRKDNNCGVLTSPTYVNL